MAKKKFIVLTDVSTGNQVGKLSGDNIRQNGSILEFRQSYYDSPTGIFPITAGIMVSVQEIDDDGS